MAVSYYSVNHLKVEWRGSALQSYKHSLEGILNCICVQNKEAQ